MHKLYLSSRTLPVNQESIHSSIPSTTTLPGKQAANAFQHLANRYEFNKSTPLSTRCQAASSVEGIRILERTRSVPNLHLSAFEASAPCDMNTLWRRDQRQFNAVRTRLLKFENELTQRYSNEPRGLTVNLSTGNSAHTKNCTQPTARSCNLTALLSATHDLLAPVFNPGSTIKDKFEYMIENILTTGELNQLFKEGLSLEQLSNIANQAFEKFQCPWVATAYSTPDTSLDQFTSLLGNDVGSRFIVNFSSSHLYGLEGNSGHFAYFDKMKIDERHAVSAHLVEHANYKYPDSPWIPLTDLYEAMSQLGTDGRQRGFILIARIETNAC